VGNHATTVVHAVALWLEKVYHQDTKPKIKPESPQHRKDFDEIGASRNPAATEGELETLKALFEKLRAGKLIEAQQELIGNNQTELYEWVSGGIPAFDNASFAESEEYGDFIENDQDRSLKIQQSTSVASDLNSNCVTGNRTNLLFVESCLSLIRGNQRVLGSLTPQQKAILEYQSGVAALQSGHYQALETLVTKYSPTEKLYKNKLWAIFRSAAT